MALGGITGTSAVAGEEVGKGAVPGSGTWRGNAIAPSRHLVAGDCMGWKKLCAPGTLKGDPPMCIVGE